MSFILEATDGTDLQIIAWNWRPTMFLVRQALNLDDERFEKLQVNGVGAELTRDEAMTVAKFLDHYLLNFPPDARLLLDGSIANAHKFYHLDLTGTRNYAAGYDWLVQFRDFCRVSGGFTVL